MRFSHHHFFVCFLYCPNFCLLVLYRESHVPIGQAGFGNAFLRLLNSVRLCCLFHNLLYQFVLVQRVEVLAPLVVLLLIQLSQTHDLFAFLKFLLELVLDELDLLLLLLFNFNDLRRVVFELLVQLLPLQLSTINFCFLFFSTRLNSFLHFFDSCLALFLVFFSFQKVEFPVPGVQFFFLVLGPSFPAHAWVSFSLASPALAVVWGSFRGNAIRSSLHAAAPVAPSFLQNFLVWTKASAPPSFTCAHQWCFWPFASSNSPCLFWTNSPTWLPLFFCATSVPILHALSAPWSFRAYRILAFSRLSWTFQVYLLCQESFSCTHVVCVFLQLQFPFYTFAIFSRHSITFFHVQASWFHLLIASTLISV